jgi:hypothetical protein
MALARCRVPGEARLGWAGPGPREIALTEQARTLGCTDLLFI